MANPLKMTRVPNKGFLILNLTLTLHYSLVFFLLPISSFFFFYGFSFLSQTQFSLSATTLLLSSLSAIPTLTLADSSLGSTSQSTSPMVVPSSTNQLVISPTDASSLIFSVSHRTRPLLWILISSSNAGGFVGEWGFCRRETARGRSFSCTGWEGSSGVAGGGVLLAGDDDSGKKKS